MPLEPQRQRRRRHGWKFNPVQDDLVPIEPVTGFSPAAHPDPDIVLRPAGDLVVDVADGHAMCLSRRAHRLVGHAPNGHPHSW